MTKEPMTNILARADNASEKFEWWLGFIFVFIGSAGAHRLYVPHSGGILWHFVFTLLLLSIVLGTTLMTQKRDNRK